MLRAVEIVKHWTGPAVDEVVLDYEDRHRRRSFLQGARGTHFLVDLPEVPDTHDGDGMRLSSGGVVLVRAADESLVEISCANANQLARIAWHIGNRHIAAEIASHTIRIRADHVIADLAVRLGGCIRHLEAAFDPEPGAYSHPPVPVQHAAPVDFEEAGL
jgi:urease accessory protein